MNKYTTIRYHIFKELSKHREKQKARSSDRIREIAIPLLSALIVQLIIVRYRRCLEGMEVGYFLALLFGVVFLFVFLTIILKQLINWYDTEISPNIRPFGKINEKLSEEQLEEADARFNYEVTYLIESAYHMAKKLTIDDFYASKLTFQNVVFCLQNADEKIKKSLKAYEIINKKDPDKNYMHIDDSSINSSMINVVFEVFKETIDLLRKFSIDNNDLLIEEVDRLDNRYNKTKSRITNLLSQGDTMS